MRLFLFVFFPCFIPWFLPYNKYHFSFMSTLFSQDHRIIHAGKVSSPTSYSEQFARLFSVLFTQVLKTSKTGERLHSPAGWPVPLLAYSHGDYCPNIQTELLIFQCVPVVCHLLHLGKDASFTVLLTYSAGSAISSPGWPSLGPSAPPHGADPEHPGGLCWTCFGFRWLMSCLYWQTKISHDIVDVV